MRKTLSNIADVIMFMVFGAWITVGFLGGDKLLGHPHLDGALMAGYIAAMIVADILRPKQEKSENRDINPAFSGVAVVVIVGLAVVVAFAWYDALALAAGAFVLTAFVASRVWAFATTHRDEIGEARFSSGTKAS